MLNVAGFYVRPRGPQPYSYDGKYTRAMTRRFTVYYAALLFSTKKLASQIRHVLNNRLVGRVGAPGRGGRSTGGTRSGAASPRQREILICAPLPHAASLPRVSRYTAPLILLDHHPAIPSQRRLPSNTYYISHYILDVIR